MISISVLFVAFTLKYLLWLPKLWNLRPVGVASLLIIEVIATVYAVIMYPSVWLYMFGFLQLYQAFNLVRIIINRMQARHLRKSTLRTAVILGICQLLLVLIALFVGGSLPTDVRLLLVGILQVAIGVIIFMATGRHLRTTKTLQVSQTYTDAQLPTVSVLVPARNETDDLQSCLEALCASDYPKLEVLVLDDCSQNKHTPQIIKGFAQSGIRFIAGQQPPDHWLAKNFAYQQLADAANGEYLVFVGVDAKLSKGAIRELITTMLEKQKSMLSILPRNEIPADARAYFVQPLRYAWELSLPRRWINRPPVLSTTWVITAKALAAAGSFKSSSRSISPESHLARTALRNDGYSFLRSNLLVSNKTLSEQHATAIRMRYPQLHRRVEWVALLSFIELIGIGATMLGFVLATFMGLWLQALLAFVGYALTVTVFAQVTAITYGKPIVWAVIIAPLAALYDVALMHISMLRYETGKVVWKDRNVCLPIMRVPGN